MIGEVAPVGCLEERQVGGVPGRDPPQRVAAAEDMSGVDGAGGKRFRRAQVQLRGGERADEREALAEGASRD